jgi:hypothetical protein
LHSVSGIDSMQILRVLPCLPLVLLADVAQAQAEESPWALTFYGARVSGEKTWQHIIRDPLNPSFVDAYLVSAALSRPYALYWGGALRLEAEGQVVYNFGDQSHWEFNAVPVVARWQRFPWSERLSTSAAFGLGLSYATEIPEVELALEDTSHQSMVYWLVELTAGPRAGPWAVSFRLHHRSDAWGLMGSDGGVNAIGLGLRYEF